MYICIPDVFWVAEKKIIKNKKNEQANQKKEESIKTRERDGFVSVVG